VSRSEVLAPGAQARAGLDAERIDADGLTRRFGVMGGFGEIHLGTDRIDTARRSIDRAVTEVRRIEASFSRYRSDSVVSRINAAAGTGKSVMVDAETRSLLDYADLLWTTSEGRFDLTSGVLRRVWDFRQAVLPTPDRLAGVRRLIGWRRVQRDGDQIRLPEAGMELDFGGIGKEYAADRAAALLIDVGETSGWVNLGGDIRVIGPRIDGRPWSFGIQHPRQAEATIATWSMADGALATSGDYERYIEVDGHRYSHLLDPITGWPVAGWQSISVQAPLCVAAGSLSTIAMLRGEGALAWLDAQGATYLAVDAAGRLHHGAPADGG
jgi:FAD:protein FMN transferase